MDRRRPAWSTPAQILGKDRRTPGLAASFRNARLWAQWDAIVGDAVAAHAQPHRLQGATLVVRVDHATWMQELTMLTPELLARIERALPHGARRPTKLRFEIGALPQRTARSTSEDEPPRASLDDEERAFIDRAVGELADEELRRAARRAMERGFARRPGKRSTD